LTDFDNNNLKTLTLVVSGVLDGNQESISIGGTAFPLATTASSTDVGSFLVSYAAVSGTFTVLPNATAPAIATKASFETLLRGITYIHNSDNPTDGNRLVTVSVADAGLNDTTTLTGEQTSVTATVTINVDPVNDQPVIGGLNAVSFSENSLQTAAAILDADVTVTDADSANFNGGTLTVSGLAENDTVSLPGTPATLAPDVIQRSGNNVQRYTGSAWETIGTCAGGVAANFVITWNLDDNAIKVTPDIAKRVIQNLTFANSSDRPPTGRTLTITLNDGDVGGILQPAAVNVAITRDNDAPTLTVNNIGATYTEQAEPMAFVSGPISVGDPDSNLFWSSGAGNAGSLTVSLDGYQSGDTLSVLHHGAGTGQIGVSGTTISYEGVNFAIASGGSAANLVFTFTSTTATPSTVQALLARLRFANSSNDDPTANGNDPSRIVTVTLNDGGNVKDAGSSTAALTASITGTITITAVNDAPMVTASGTLSYTENATAAAIRSSLTITDADDTDIAGATVTINPGFTTGDVLGFTDQNEITGS
jgi:hypothetical protein